MLILSEATQTILCVSNFMLPIEGSNFPAESPVLIREMMSFYPCFEHKYVRKLMIIYGNSRLKIKKEGHLTTSFFR